MKKSKSLIAGLLAMTMLLCLNSCRDKSYEEITYVASIPVVMGFDEFRGAVKSTVPKVLQHPGKIYFKDNYIFLNEFQEGIHIIDNSDPANPVIVNFLQIPGNTDMAVKDNILLVNSYIDLVAIDISNPLNPVEVDRIENAFPNVLPPLDDIESPIYGLDFAKGVVVGWEKRQVTEVIERENSPLFGRMVEDSDGVPNISGTEVRFNSSYGTGGSMARFTLSGNYLYALHNNILKLFNLSGQEITPSKEVLINREAETIFPHGNNLFIGTFTGMLIYDISSPAFPTFISEFDHITSCDPVVVEGDYAYVTLRSGTSCLNTANQLDVIDISSLAHPFLVKTYPMYNPHGLGIDNNILFICDGDAGLKVFDATDPMAIHQNQIAYFPDINTYDVIPLDGLLIMTGANGLYQYDYTDPESLQLISVIPIVNYGSGN